MLKPVLFVVITLFAVACGGSTATDFNQAYIAVENAIRDGQITDYGEAEHRLDSLVNVCNVKLSSVEFETDEGSRAETANLKTVIEKITTKKAQLQAEKQSYQALSTQGGKYYVIRSLSGFIEQYPDGLMTKAIEAQCKTSAEQLIDELTQSLQKGKSSVTPSNTTAQLYQFTNYVQTTTGLDESGGEEYADNDVGKSNEQGSSEPVFENEIQRLGTMRNALQTVLSLPVMNITTSNGNSPQSLKDQFDNYENHLREMKTKGEEMIKSLVVAELHNTSWESQAQFEMTTYIVRDRVGIFSLCSAGEIVNKITQAQDFDVQVKSNRVEIGMTYNVSSFCGGNIKYKYYKGEFTLVFPVIEGKLGEGYFTRKSITQTN